MYKVHLQLKLKRGKMIAGRNFQAPLRRAELLGSHLRRLHFRLLCLRIAC